jgi:hypothetical protein
MSESNAELARLETELKELEHNIVELLPVVKSTYIGPGGSVQSQADYAYLGCMYERQREISARIHNLKAGTDHGAADVPKAGTSEEHIALALFDGTIKLISLKTDGSYGILGRVHDAHNFFYLFSSEALALQSAVEELEWLMNDSSTREQAFQDFFERNPDFILNDEYKNAHPKIQLIGNASDALIPDFVLEPIRQDSLCDLLELKLPTAQLFVMKTKRIRYSAAVFEACAQLREYSAFFDEVGNRERIQRKYGLLSYRPKMFVIIGRRGNVNPILVRRLQNDLPRELQLLTYDDILERVKAKIK